MEIFPNWTVLPILIFLITLTYILNRTFFRPMGEVLLERHRRIQGARKEAEEIRQSLQDKLAEFDRKLREARRESDERGGRTGISTSDGEQVDQLRRSCRDPLSVSEKDHQSAGEVSERLRRNPAFD